MIPFANPTIRNRTDSRTIPRLWWALATIGVILPSVPLAGQTVDCEPASQRGGRSLGCFITAREELGALPRDSALFWHIDAFASESAAVSVRGPRSTVVQSLGRSWLFTIAAATWRAGGGRHLATIGPLPLVDAAQFAAVYMEGVFKPGMQTAVHRHPGVEAWYTLDGEMCVETPKGMLVQRAGGPAVMVPGGNPMQLTGTGTELRRSLVLILQDATQPRSTHAMDWVPKGLCSH